MRASLQIVFRAAIRRWAQPRLAHLEDPSRASEDDGGLKGDGVIETTDLGPLVSGLLVSRVPELVGTVGAAQGRLVLHKGGSASRTADVFFNRGADHPRVFANRVTALLHTHRNILRAPVAAAEVTPETPPLP